LISLVKIIGIQSLSTWKAAKQQPFVALIVERDFARIRRRLDGEGVGAGENATAQHRKYCPGNPWRDISH
jgi:hypothetical protein